MLSIVDCGTIFRSDIFDQKFIEVCCRGITIYPFKEPPKVVLDLGCGAGTWALEAADRWPVRINAATMCAVPDHIH